jgi:hypothetical protein
VQLKQIISRGKFVLGVAVGILLAGSAAYSSNVFNSPETGYLLCVNQKTKVVTYPSTPKCPTGTSRLVIGVQGPRGEQGLPGKDGVDGKNGLDGKDGLTPTCDKVGLNAIQGNLKFTCIASADGFVWSTGLPFVMPTPMPSPVTTLIP